MYIGKEFRTLPLGQTQELLCSSSAGNRSAEAEFVPAVYDELRRLAASYMRSERPDHTLQPTALAHEAYLRLAVQNSNWENPAHFLGVAARQMRRILVDHARKRAASKRAGGEVRVAFEDVLAVAAETPHQLLDVDRAMERLASEYPRHARVVELRFFAGYAEDEIAGILEISVETVKRDWRFAKAWLNREMGKGHDAD